MFEIKFRVWDKVEKRFRDNGLTNHEHETNVWTGLLDNHRVPIYEGDIVKYVPDHIIIHISLTDWQRQYSAAEVKFWSGSFMLCESKIGSAPIQDYAWPENGSNLEIIGNIYEGVRPTINLTNKDSA